MRRNRGLPATARAELIASGPGRLCQALELSRPAHNGLDLLDSGSPLTLEDDGHPAATIRVTPRIGINVARDWPLRFVLQGHPSVSGPRSMR